MSYYLYIKNMVDPASFEVVNQILKDAGLNIRELAPGRVTLLSMPEKNTISKLNDRLLPLGYSILNTNADIIALRIKTALSELLENKALILKTNLSVYLSNKIHYEYHYLSTVFSDSENISIEKYYIKLKIEKAKELISKTGLTISEIAYQLGYSSPAHLTNQFKKFTGITPSQFKTTQKIKK